MKHFTETSRFEKLTDIIEEYGEELVGSKHHAYVTYRAKTPEGEDWQEEFEFDGTIQSLAKAIRLRIEDFDVDEEAMIWIPHRGKNGVPSSIKALVYDAEWKLQKLASLRLIVSEIAQEEYTYEGQLDLQVCDDCHIRG